MSDSSLINYRRQLYLAQTSFRDVFALDNTVVNVDSKREIHHGIKYYMVT